MLSFFAACGAAFGRVQGLAWCGETNLASFDLFQGKPIVLSFFSLSAVRLSSGRKAWLDAARQTWQNFDLFQGNPIVLLLFSLSAVRPSTGRKAWCGKANLASFDLFQGNPIVLSFFFAVCGAAFGRAQGLVRRSRASSPAK